MEAPEQVKVAVLEEQMKTISKGMEMLVVKIDNLSDKIDSNYVKKEDFKPVRETVESLKYWQAKVVGYAAGVGLIIEIAFKYFGK